MAKHYDYQDDLMDILADLDDLTADLEDIRDDAQDILDDNGDPFVKEDIKRLDRVLDYLAQAAEELDKEE